MKKTWLKSFLIYLFLMAPLSADVSSAKIKAVSGTVEVIADESQPPQKAVTGQSVQPPNIIQTSEKSYCVVEMTPDNSFRIKQNSRVKIEKIFQEAQQSGGTVVKETQLSLIGGELTAKLDQLPKDSTFHVSGPVAIAGAAGTAFTVAVNSETRATSVAVLDHAVIVQGVQDSQKSVRLEQYQQMQASPWDSATLAAEGRGVLSESILGKSFVREAESDIRIQSEGQGADTASAKLSALHHLSQIVRNLRVDTEHTLDSVMEEKPSMAKAVYEVIAQARIIGSIENPDSSVTVKAEIQLKELTQSLGMPLFGIGQSVIPITLSEYSAKFSALARVTTQRAAQVEGYRNLAEIIYGTVIDATTTIEDFAVKEDSVKTAIQGLVKGAQVVKTHYFSDGSMIVDLEVRADLVPHELNPIMGDVFGQTYVSGPRLIEFRDFNDYLTAESRKS